MRFVIVTLALLSSSIACMAAGPETPLPQPKVRDAVQDVFAPVPYETQKISGLLGERMRINLEKRLLAIEEEQVLAGFRQRPGVQDWIGEHAGKYLDAAANTWRFTHDPRLREQMDRIALALIACQKDDGYLGTYTDDKRWTSWDVWVHKYDLLGLLAWYRVSGDERALNASKKIGDLLIATFEDGSHDIVKAGEHVGMAATSVLEPICQLYRYTGDARYLQFARFIVEKTWEQPNGPKILSSLLTTGSVFKTANAKAYEMTSNLVGLLELYRLTGEVRYLKAAQAAQSDIVQHRLYVTGTTSSHEHFRDDFDLPGEQKDDVGEGCVTVTWLQLNWQLLRLTGEARYGQELERTVFNQLLAAQDPKTGNICYFTPLNGKKEPRTDINCCRSSEPRGISMIPALVWGSLAAKDGNDTIAVQILTPGKALIDDVLIASETGYPFSRKTVLTLTPNKPHVFTLAVRVPEWAGFFRARLNSSGEILTGKPGEYLRITREWQRGDRLLISVDLRTRFVAGGKSYPNSFAVESGPLVLALDKGANFDLGDIGKLALKPAPPQVGTQHEQQGMITGWDIKAAARRTTPTERLIMERPGLYALPGVSLNGEQSKDVTLHLVPFADAGEYRVWIPRQVGTR
jgi:DUF1680 family protein